MSRLFCRGLVHVSSFPHLISTRRGGFCKLECLYSSIRSKSARFNPSGTSPTRAGCLGNEPLSQQASNIQYTIHDVPGDIVDELCDILLCNGAVSTSVSEHLEEGGVEQEIFKDVEVSQTLQENPEYWDRCRVQACFAIYPSSSSSGSGGEDDYEESRGAVEESLSMLGVQSDITSDVIRPQDWEKNIKDEYQSMQITDSLWIVPSWDVGKESREDVTHIILEPGLAFGTGDHPTTRLCLSWIHSLHMKGVQTTQLLDYGTGSGVLAIAALVMDVASTAVGTDIEPLSVKASKYNASLNNVDDRFNVYLVGTEHDGPTVSQHDIIVANILQGPLVSLAPTLASHRRSSGETLLALSGITTYQVQVVIAAYSPWFEEFEVTRDPSSNWALITARSI